jgi:hypothetical protein|eukprot:SAG25_NODE_617_length_6447_cov_3.593164_6_plen_48_part_00
MLKMLLLLDLVWLHVIKTPHSARFEKLALAYDMVAALNVCMGEETRM